MGAKSRNKGAAGERELARILREHIGDGITRNWQGQAAKGGHDLDGLPFVLEVKRYKTATDAQKRAWWYQALDQAIEYNDHNKSSMKTAALAYRADKQQWRVVVPLALFDENMTSDDVSALYLWTAEISIEAFCQICRERMGE